MVRSLQKRSENIRQAGNPCPRGTAARQAGRDIPVRSAALAVGMQLVTRHSIEWRHLMEGITAFLRTYIQLFDDFEHHSHVVGASR